MTDLTDQVADHLYHHDPDADADDGECVHCGGEGEIHDCIDGCCVDAEEGCDLCSRPCPECAMRERERKLAAVRAERVAFLLTLDVDAAIRWLKKHKRWDAAITRNTVLANIHAARAALPELTPEQRAASACWVEGLL